MTVNLLLQTSAVGYTGSLTHGKGLAHQSTRIVKITMKLLIQQISTLPTFGESK